jgi:hypothetical protein
MKQIMQFNEKDDVEKISLRKKVREMCTEYSIEAYKLDKSKSLCEWYAYFLNAMRESYKKGLLRK